MNIWQHFLDNRGNAIYKWHHYFPAYERHFGPWRNKSLFFLEVGVMGGGSLAMWRRFFGPLAIVVGIDINSECARLAPSGVEVRIGDQSDPAFLQGLCDEFGPPDVVLDDGSHRMEDLWNTFSFLYPRMGKNAVYAVEDLQTCYWPEYGGGVLQQDSFINRAKGLVDELHADHTRGAVQPTAFTRQTLCMSFYDSLLFFEKGTVARKEAMVSGEWPETLGPKPPTLSPCTANG
jgi:hypothetical protein